MKKPELNKTATSIFHDYLLALQALIGTHVYICLILHCAGCHLQTKAILYVDQLEGI